jgi:hypothetical protein
MLSISLACRPCNCIYWSNIVFGGSGYEFAATELANSLDMHIAAHCVFMHTFLQFFVSFQPILTVLSKPDSHAKFRTALRIL